MALKPPAAVGSLLAAMALATANPTLTAHAVEPPAVVRNDLQTTRARYLPRGARAQAASITSDGRKMILRPQVQQYGASMVADADSDLRDAQKRFLEERAVRAKLHCTVPIRRLLRARTGRSSRSLSRCLCARCLRPPVAPSDARRRSSRSTIPTRTARSLTRTRSRARRASTSPSLPASSSSPLLPRCFSSSTTLVVTRPGLAPAIPVALRRHPLRIARARCGRRRAFGAPCVLCTYLLVGGAGVLLARAL